MKPDPGALTSRPASTPAEDNAATNVLAEHRTAVRRAARARRAAVVALRRRALTCRSLGDVFDVALDTATSVLALEFAKVGEYDAAHDTLVLRAARGWQRDMVGRCVEHASTSCQSGYALRMRRPLVIEDLRLVPALRDVSFVRANALVSGVTVLVHGQHGEYGALTMHSTRHRLLTPDELDFLQAVADVVAAAVYRFSLSTGVEVTRVAPARATGPVAARRG